MHEIEIPKQCSKFKAKLCLCLGNENSEDIDPGSGSQRLPDMKNG